MMMVCQDCGTRTPEKPGARCPVHAARYERMRQRKQDATRPNSYRRGFDQEYKRNGDALKAEWRKHGGSCFRCGLPIVNEADITIDHKIPRALGGTNIIQNLAISHLRCNSRAGGRMRGTK